MKLQHHDPTRLEPSECHVRRTHIDPAEEFVRNVSEVGIVVPLQGRYEGGKLRLIDGVRRAQAAAEAGLETVPVLVREMDDAEATAASVALNDAQAGVRKSVSDRDRERAVSRAADMRDTEPDSEKVRLGLLSDADRIHQELEAVNGVGPRTAEALAEVFDSVEELREGSLGDFARADGVGMSKATAIHDWFNPPTEGLMPVTDGGNRQMERS